MSCILYYSKYCKICEKYIQQLSGKNLGNSVHFICIDKRTQQNNNTYIVMENGQQILLPANVTKVPALLLLSQGGIVLFGEKILEYLLQMQGQQQTQMQQTQQMQQMQQTQQMQGQGIQTQIQQPKQTQMDDPQPFAFHSGGFGDIISDTYSMLGLSDDDLSAKGNGGMNQMHNYTKCNDYTLQYVGNQGNQETLTTRINADKSADLVAQIQAQRDNDVKQLTGNRPPIAF